MLLTDDSNKNKELKNINPINFREHFGYKEGTNKLNQKRSVNDGGALIVDPGDKTHKEIIKNIEKGILLSRFSGGYPSSNGDFSGVAKNSYYIENGQIKHPVIETMISGNIAQMFMNIRDVSKENINFGDSILPWVSFDGVTIS